MRRAACAMLCLLPALAMAAPPLGRLFYTPEQRARMDVARQQERNVRIEDEEAAPAAPPPANIILNGVITRSDGKTTVWINNRPQTPEQTGQGVGVQGRGGQINVTLPDARRNVPLKVGQSLDVTSGKVEEVYRRAPPVLALESGGGAAQVLPEAGNAKPATAKELPRQDANPNAEGRDGAPTPRY